MSDDKTTLPTAGAVLGVCIGEYIARYAPREEVLNAVGQAYGAIKSLAKGAPENAVVETTLIGGCSIGMAAHRGLEAAGQERQERSGGRIPMPDKTTSPVAGAALGVCIGEYIAQGASRSAVLHMVGLAYDETKKIVELSPAHVRKGDALITGGCGVGLAAHRGLESIYQKE